MFNSTILDEFFKNSNKAIPKLGLVSVTEFLFYFPSSSIIIECGSGPGHLAYISNKISHKVVTIDLQPDSFTNMSVCIQPTF
jgi:hypothetical protein